MEEIWKEIKGYEGQYEISSHGNVRSLDRVITGYSQGRSCFIKGRVKKQYDTNGYLGLSLCKDGFNRSFRTHRVVAEAFIPNPENKPEVNHKDGVKTNNRVENLEWNTHSENIKHAHNTGLKRNALGENHFRSTASNKLVVELKEALNEDKYTVDYLVKKFKVSTHLISKVKNNKTRKSLNLPEPLDAPRFRISSPVQDRGRLTASEVIAIREMLEEGIYLFNYICHKFQITNHTLHCIRKGITWKHLKFKKQ